MMLIIMCDLKSFDDAATLFQGQKHEVAGAGFHSIAWNDCRET
jgi:hypothetical protein